MSDPKNSATAEKRTLVEEGTKFKGSLTSTCPIVVQGSIEGDVEGPSITVSSSGAVSGRVAAGALTSAGKIAGDFDVDTARVEGSVENDTIVRASSLDVKLTATTGKIQLTFGQPGSGSRGRS
jgi:cytoskeletal protein CcmA (bactofilin family)